MSAHQLSLFAVDRLPHNPYCSNDLATGLRIRSAVHALQHRYIQPNRPAERFWMVYDIDRDQGGAAWIGEVAEPNYTVINQDNGHAHLIYALDVPVITSDAGRLKPLRYAAAIEGAYTHRLGADRSYTGLICKNPIHPGWGLRHGPETAYGLGDLAEYIANIASWRQPSRMINTSLGRNCQLFEALRLWSYRNINRTAWISYAGWYDACLHQAHTLNAFPSPLPLPEIKATARSVAKWVWQRLRGGTQADYIERTHTSEIQAARGRKSGASRRKGTLLENDREPWVKEGISRSTWYRRQAKRNETEPKSDNSPTV